MLLRNEKIQEELKITDEQKQKLTAMQEEGGGGGRRGGGGGGNLSDEERAARQKRIDESNKKAEAVLEAGQLKRLKEISLQVRGYRALADDEVATALKLTADQKDAVKTIQGESDKRMGELFSSGGGGDREERQKKFAELQKDTDDEYLAVLNDEQKAKLAEMKGAKFDTDSLRRGGRRRGGNNN